MTSKSVALATQVGAWRDPEWQRLWLSSRRGQTWRSLALVPASAGTPPETLREIAVAMARTGIVHMGAPVHVADASSLVLAQLEAFTEVLENHTKAGDLVLVALGSLQESVTALPLALKCDAALLCVVAGQMRSKEARATVAQVGAGRFVGSAMFRPQPAPDLRR